MNDQDGSKAMMDSAEEVDLTSCDREPIHALGAVQSFGFLIAMTSDGMIARTSANIAELLGQGPGELQGAMLADILAPEAMHHIRGTVQNIQSPDAVERILAVALVEDGASFDLAVHLSDRLIVIEAEPTDPERIDEFRTVRSMVSRLQATSDDDVFFRQAVRHVRALTGFDRVMLYRFGRDGSGEVIAEQHASGMTPYLGLRYPASDIPKQARALYVRNPLRIISDVSDPGVAVVPPRGPTGEPLDLSMSVLRAVSPIHLEYLSNMGVQASLSISIIVNGKLWGLFACHHQAPRQVGLGRRTAAELFGQMFSLLLEGREREKEVQYEAHARGLHQQIMATMADGGSTATAIIDKLEDVSGLVSSDGVGAWIDGNVSLRGSTPTKEEFAELVRFLNLTPAGEAFATDELGGVHPPAQDYAERAAGILAVPVSRQPRDYLVFFRREVARSVLWAGDPEKPVTVGPNGVRLTPRKSFEAWRQVERGRSEPWGAADMRIAEQLRVTLLEVILRVTDAAERERRAGQERQELLIAELNHRVRNILGLIRGLVGQSSGSAASVEGFADTIGGRIQALARAHDQITAAGWGATSLREMLTVEADAYMGGGAPRVRMEGADVLIDPMAIPIVALVVHEMLTNAAKYGALADNSGHIDIGWRQDEMGRLHISWRESGGPPVQAPTRRGFGTTVIERSIPHELRGEAEVRYELTGVEAEFALPARYVEPAPEAPAVAAPISAAPAEAVGFDGHALVVEDNLLIAMDAEDMLMGLGAEPVTVAASVTDALRAIDAERPDYAVLDVNLGSETSLPVAERLKAMGVPFLFATGYGEGSVRPPGMEDVPVLPKPYDAAMLRTRLAALLGEDG